MLRKRIQLGLVHAAVAMTLVPINSTLNRVMIKELALSATLVAVLASLPYFFSPIQVAIGSFSDRHPILGRRRTPYIILGLLLCVVGVVLAPKAAFAMAENWQAALPLGIAAFGAWGMGYNLAAVSYLSLASEISDEKGRGKTVAVMWFMMISGIIVTAILLSRLVDPYTPAALVSAFWTIGLAALALGLLGIAFVEPPSRRGEKTEIRYTWTEMFQAVIHNKQATNFFVYLVVLLAALLGQDILLEPYGAEAFGMSVKDTTRITSLWGGTFLIALLAAGVLENRLSKRRMAVLGGWGALFGFALIAGSGVVHSKAVFYSGVTLLGLGSGLSTVANLSLMLEMTTAANVGLFIGAWGMANAVSRLVGSVMGGALRDSLTQILSNPVFGYVVVFALEGLLLLVSLLMLRKIDVNAFLQKAESPSLIERAAMASEA